MRTRETHPQLQAFIEESEDASAVHELPVEEVRAIADDVFAVEDPEPVGDVIDRTIDGPGGDLPLRISLPDGEEPFAVTMFFHGGGFVAGGLESHDQFCRTFGNTAGVAVVAHVARDRDGPDIAYQMLLYPPVSPHQGWDSIDENGEGYFITAADPTWFDEQYFEHEVDAMNVSASPLLAPDFEGLALATVVTGGFAPLRDEGVASAERLEEAGVDVSHHHYDDAIHAFIQLAAEPFEFDRSREALADIADDLRTALE